MTHRRLQRELGVGGAVLLGLGSIVGTGVFVGIGLAVESAGPAVLIALLIAGILATLNGLSSAQLAAAHPTSGGTYEYGYRFLSAPLGFTAGWMFLAAKSASAATAALGFAGYTSILLGWDARLPLAFGALASVTAIVLSGIRRSAWANAAILAITVGGLLWFTIAGSAEISADSFRPLMGERGLPGLLEASALMFVAYTGYGRIATLGEEVAEPRNTIPKAIITTLVVTVLLYGVVAFTAVGSVGADALAGFTDEAAAPLELAARTFAAPAVGTVVAVAAITAMLAVLLNLVLGLSRVLLAMGRRGDVPRLFAGIDRSGRTPVPAVVGVAVIIGMLVAIGSVRTAWTFSAFTVLVYYAITNLAATRLPDEYRRFPRALAWLGLAGCLGLAFWVDAAAWMAGLALIGVGLVWMEAARRLRQARS